MPAAAHKVVAVVIAATLAKLINLFRKRKRALPKLYIGCSSI